MQILLATIITVLLTLLFHPVLEKLGEKQSFKYHFHHSILGILILVCGIILKSNLVTGLGLGFYLGHVLEEILFCKTNIIKAFFIFVTV